MNNQKADKARERIPTEVFEDGNLAVQALADEIQSLIISRQKAGQNAVLGLATGSTPVPVYRELIRRHREEGLSFRNVITFNLDEYFPLSADHPESYHYFMKSQLFDHIDICPENIHIPDGDCGKDDVFEMCERYEQAIENAGGLDLQILGIGRTGHIGFNEPGSSLHSKTRMVTLDSLTRSDAAKDFLGESHVPRHAITMGVGTIMKARSIFLLAWGRAKADILRVTIEEEPVDTVPASYLQQHDNVRIWIDRAAASELTRFRRPWLVSFPDWTRSLERKAITNLSLTLEKPLLKLIDKDYQENGLADLVTEKGPAYDLNLKIFNQVQHTITGWPGGKPGVDDERRPERAVPEKKRVVVLSPEPLDDVMAMGATINRLVSQGHDVTVCYLTSGNLGVPDEEALRASQLMMEVGCSDEQSLVSKSYSDLSNKQISEGDTPEVRKLKGFIRKNEAKASLALCGLMEEDVIFLDLPFYENGRYRQFLVGNEDSKQLVSLLNKKRPHQVFFTGATADPSSVRAKTFQVLNDALKGSECESWSEDCWFWEFSGNNREWDVSEIEMAVPCSPDELEKKVQSIYVHRSQMHQVPLSGSDSKDIWEEVQLRNRNTAELYDALGLAEYEAIECFRRWK